MSGDIERWQYRLFGTTWKDGGYVVRWKEEDGAREQRLGEVLDDLGSHGWELVAVIPVVGGGTTEGAMKGRGHTPIDFDFALTSSTAANILHFFLKRRS